LTRVPSKELFVPALTRRQLLSTALGAAGVAALGACGSNTGKPVAAGAGAVSSAEAARRRAGARVVTAHLTPQPVTLDLGGPTVSTWAYGQQLPGPLVRARAGDLLRIRVDNHLAADTSVHWHGVALRNDMDGVPGVTQEPIRPGGSFTYEFTAPDPGTFFYHPHVGVQLDRGLYGPLIIDDPSDPGDYDAEWVLVLDDWVDGTGRTPDQVLASLTATSSTSSGGMSGMSGMDHGMSGMDGSGMSGMGESMTSSVLGGAGDVSYPYYLINGRVPTAPLTLTGKPKQRVRLRLINAGTDTAFRVALGGHKLTVTHTDGYPVTPASTDALLVAMGERFDVEVTLADGIFPLVAAPEGKTGTPARALLRTGAGSAPAVTVRPAELDGQLTLGYDLRASDAARLPAASVDRTHTVLLAGSMSPYRWTMNGRTYPDSRPLPVKQGERVRLQFSNHSMMFHPMHLHGHTFALPGGGARKDTVIVRPMTTMGVDLDAANPGQWMIHCHNLYHAEAGMMTTLSYRS
jgi:FtsP/CotA-like multicopper oxidase with cupredoxin domain